MHPLTVPRRMSKVIKHKLLLCFAVDVFWRPGRRNVADLDKARPQAFLSKATRSSMHMLPQNIGSGPEACGVARRSAVLNCTRRAVRKGMSLCTWGYQTTALARGTFPVRPPLSRRLSGEARLARSADGRNASASFTRLT